MFWECSLSVLSFIYFFIIIIIFLSLPPHIDGTISEESHTGTAHLNKDPGMLRPLEKPLALFALSRSDQHCCSF